MRLLAAAALIALFTLPAHSQQNKSNWGSNPQADAEAQERKERSKDIEQAYEQAKKHTTTSRQTTNASDPWQIARPPSSSSKQ
jgi:hypothetical protein